MRIGDSSNVEETGRIDSFAVATGLKPGGLRAPFFNEYDFKQPHEVSSVFICWCDDAGRDR